MTELTSDLKANLSKSIRTLSSDISRVEKELDLELENLGDLLDKRHPEVARQLEALNGSIQKLHRSLAEVRAHLGGAQSETTEIHETLERTKDRIEQASSAEESEEELSASTAETERHSSEVTLGSVLRALLMAEEPGQRHGEE